MQPVLSADEMRSCDEAAIRDFGIAGMVLMENAGKAIAERCRDLSAPLQGKSVVVFCGKGNNGGDGFVAGRHLANAEAMVTIVLFDPPARFKGDAKQNLVIAQKIARKEREHLRFVRYSRSLLATLKPDLVIDGIFGTGFSGKLPASQAGAVRWMNAQRCPVVAVDIPSGINGTSGVMANEAVRATETVTMGALKSGLIHNDGRERCGSIKVVDIGIPSVVFRRRRDQTMLIGTADVRNALPVRSQTAHKYAVGKVFVLAGSRGFTGAAALAASAALRTGAGAVVLAAPDTVYPILAKKLSEAIVIPLPSTPDGTIAPNAAETIRERMEWADSTVMGPGLSRNGETQSLVRELVGSASGKLVLDADALTAIAGTNVLKSSKAEIILTPHSGEFSRLNNQSAKEIDRNRVDAARNFLRQPRRTLVLKGAPTAVADGKGTVYLNSTGNPGMATVGSGDVLSGIIGSLWAQGMEAGAASWSGVFLHGLAGDLAAGERGQRSVVAGDLIEFLPKAFQQVGEGD